LLFTVTGVKVFLAQIISQANDHEFLTLRNHHDFMIVKIKLQGKFVD
jgi:hypothetical protein